MPALVFATHNAHKLKEVRQIFGRRADILGLGDIGCDEELPETSGTFEGNALQKARYVADKFGVDCFADDSGLEVAALGGAPGVDSAQYAGTRSSAGNIRKLLSEMRDEPDRRARFRTVIVSILGGEVRTFEGLLAGTLAGSERGENGFGYDPVFVPDGQGRTLAEMTAEEKNALSHRALAVRGLADYLAARPAEQPR